MLLTQSTGVRPAGGSKAALSTSRIRCSPRNLPIILPSPPPCRFSSVPGSSRPWGWRTSPGLPKQLLLSSLVRGIVHLITLNSSFFPSLCRTVYPCNLGLARSCYTLFVSFQERSTGSQHLPFALLPVLSSCVSAMATRPRSDI